MFGSGREAFPDVQEALLYVRERSGGPPRFREWSTGLPGCPRVVERPSQMSGRCWEDFPDVRECWEAFPVVREALLNVRERSGCPPKFLGGPPGCPGVVGMPS